MFQDEEVRGLNTKVGYVPQESKLFPWLTVEENVGFGLDSRQFSRADRNRQVSQFIHLAGLAGFEKYYPGQLSGGMSKRASIVRALVYEPPVILMNQEGWQKVLDFSIGAGIVKDRTKAPSAKEGVLWTNKYVGKP